MSWIQENKFTAGLLGVTLAGAIGLGALGYTKSSATAEIVGECEELQYQLDDYQNASIYPDAENLEIRREKVNEFRDAVADIQAKMLAYRPEKSEKLTPEQLSAKRVEIIDAIGKKFKANGVAVPENSQFGTERFVGQVPRPEAVALLNYQFGGIEAILNALADSRPKGLVNVYRHQLDVETGRKAANKKPGVYRAMPVEVTFRGNEESVREFLSKIANLESHFVAVRSVRLTNQRTRPPRVDDAEFKVVEEDDAADLSGFEGFEEDGEVTEEVVSVDVTPGERILKQVLGREQVYAHVRMDILLFRKGIDIPEIN
ncbi:Amuc_1100 family pilus-like protein [Persicirhabdus sediminis]|uniref:Uncharacterized protein n=1 Tax=Persicirhabdus sediminis TaxID=454144 RepID=A0A8J7SFX6_9BACT|nr:Amuc_1100 family pilus-like protein [Persicirhabdus sediminis]MBK1789750.1 hypothetical protein [Persicirhabdus sediminis]